MGLDMYAYVATQEYDHNTESDSREIAYWRKHPNLHGWMHQLWRSKNSDIVVDAKDAMFNGIELELTYDDILQLEEDVKNGRLPSTSGFFFGEASDDYYLNKDLEFVKNAKAELFLGLRVFYNSSW
jgi:hypothetical protein